MLGRRQVTETKVGPYVWLTYQEVHDAALRMGSAIRSRGVNPGDRCGIFGSNCPQWLTAMEACNSHTITYVPLYDTLGFTESCGGCLTSIGNVFPMMGTVGVPMTTIETRLESVPEMGYDALSSVPGGEICLRGKSLFSGYHKRQDLTEEVLVDGVVSYW
ncbi:long chain acyl-CoA synthetase 2 [Prunus persica]|uniref:long chain acyl-CoA synthetase 2 n=1 Tax=Prunus persica TaxID=3760 RepID=UPI0009AB6FDC|nr:long chain acyl-CoA synthetase 2 [Prunus persica]